MVRKWLGFFWTVVSFSLCYSSEISLKTFKCTDMQEIALMEAQLENCCFEAFKKAYQTVWSPEREAATKKIFPTHLTRFKNYPDEYTMIVAIQEDKVLGWTSFKGEACGVYLDCICTDPNHWKEGIGKKLILSIFDHLPNTKKISLITRKINAVAPSFYEHLGFKQTDFMAQEYSSHDYQGYEWCLE